MPPFFMKIHKSPLVFGVALLLALTLPARANLLTFQAELLGSNESNPNNSAAVGFGQVIFDDVTNVALIDEFWNNLTGVAIATHIHGPALPGINGPVIIPIPLGIHSNASDEIQQLTIVLTDIQASWLLDGLLYMNIHTTVFPGGEIRGQLLRVPDTGLGVPDAGPGALGLLAMSGMVWLGARRKRNS